MAGNDKSFVNASASPSDGQEHDAVRPQADDTVQGAGHTAQGVGDGAPRVTDSSGLDMVSSGQDTGSSGPVAPSSEPCSISSAPDAAALTPDVAAEKPEAIASARSYFPRGLSQPERGYRFSVDALLLARFATVSSRMTGPVAGRGSTWTTGRDTAQGKTKDGARVLDLGCGCGVIGLGLLLSHPRKPLLLTGLDNDPDMLVHARHNAALLGVGGQVNFAGHDVSRVDSSYDQQYDLVLANPPFRDGSGGRRSAEERLQARFDTTADTEAFIRFGARALKTRGRLALVHLPERLPELLACCTAAGLAPKRLRFVHGKASKDAKIVLLEAVRAGGKGLVVEPPLILYEEGQGKTAVTGDALGFCPWLGCNV